MRRILATMGRWGKRTEAPEQRVRFGALTREQLLVLAKVPLDAGLLKVAVHVMRGEGERARQSLGAAGARGLTDSQVREECGAMGAAERIEQALLELVCKAHQ